MEQLIVSPLRPWELILGKIIPYIFVGYAQITIALFAGIIVFNVPVRGSITLLYVLSSLFITASLSLGVLISSCSKTQMQAIQMGVFVLLPSIMLSGFIFPRESRIHAGLFLLPGKFFAAYVLSANFARHFIKRQRAGNYVAAGNGAGNFYFADAWCKH